MKNIYITLFLLTFYALNAYADENVKQIVLYQSDEVLKEKLFMPYGSLAEYSVQVETKLQEVFARQSPIPDFTGTVIVAIKPGNQVRFWFANGENEWPDQNLPKLLREELSKIPVVPVRDGPVVFGIKYFIGRGGIPVAEKFPIPEEWKSAMDQIEKSRLTIPDDPLSILWPDQKGLSLHNVGVFEGELTVTHVSVTPESMDEIPKSISTRLEFAEEKILMANYQNENWLYYQGSIEVDYETESHIALSGVSDTGGYIENYRINLIKLDGNNYQAYISKVVDNYTFSEIDAFRHFTVMSEGVLKKKTE